MKLVMFIIKYKIYIDDWTLINSFTLSDK